MKRYNIYISLLISFFLAGNAFGQKEWSLVRDNNWIQVYESDMEHSNYKRIKVECNVEGTFDKLVQLLNDVNNHKNWIYNTKQAYILKRVNQSEYYYYTETALPWPLQNRDAVVHIKFIKDSLNRFLKILAAGEPDFMAVARGKVRVPVRLIAGW